MEFTPEIIVQFVMYALSIGIIYGTIRQQIETMSIELQRLRSDYKDEIKLLRCEVEKHNSVIERTYRLEAEVATIKERGDDN